MFHQAEDYRWLYGAASNGDLDKVRRFVNEGSNVNAANSKGYTPLHAAVIYKHLHVVQFLVQEGKANVNATTALGHSTPLCFASENGDVDVARFLIEQQAAMHIKTCKGYSPLHIAVDNGHLDLVKLFLSSSPDEEGAGASCDVNEDKTEYEGNATIHLAARNGDLEMTQLLIEECGADVNNINNEQYTPLHVAASHPNDHVEVVKELVSQHGANAYATTRQGCSLLHLAAENGNPRVFHFLLLLQEECGTAAPSANMNTADGATPMHAACQGGCLSIVRLLIEQCAADVHATTATGHTPLHVASSYGHVEVVRYLVAECGADITATTTEGYTPLHLASQGGHCSVAHCLIGLGAVINVRSSNGDTPLHGACMSGQQSEDLCQLLLERGAAVDAENNRGCTALHYASRNGDVGVVRLLVSCGANVNAVSTLDGSTALHCSAGAVVEGGMDVMQFLVRSGGRINAKDCKGRTPLHHALVVGGGHMWCRVTSLIQWLTAHGADVNCPDVDGVAPMHLAATSGCLQVVQCLVERGANIQAATNAGATPTILAASSDTCGVDTIWYLLVNGALFF